MAKRDDFFLLNDMLHACSNLLRFTEGKKFVDFLDNEMLQRAVEREFSILGEAANQVSQALKAQVQELDWRAIVDFRNRLIHDYAGVDPLRVWEILQTYIPTLRQQLLSIIEAHPKS
jgi:uncharacterized protein with HEPN domain